MTLIINEVAGRFGRAADLCAFWKAESCEEQNLIWQEYRNTLAWRLMRPKKYFMNRIGK